MESSPAAADLGWEDLDGAGDGTAEAVRAGRPGLSAPVATTGAQARTERGEEYVPI